MCHVLEVTNQLLRLRHTLVQQLWLPRQWPLFASICIVTVPAIEAPGNFHLIWPSIQWTFSLEVKESLEFLQNHIFLKANTVKLLTLPAGTMYVTSLLHIKTLHYWPKPIWSWNLKCMSGWKNLLWLWPAFSHELYYYMKVEFLLE